MPRVIALFLALMLGPTFACAAPIVVKAGEHPEHTRIVLHLPHEMTWETEEQDRHLSIVFPSKSEFDLTDAFTRIGRERVSDMLQIPDGLKIAYGCECKASVFSSGKRMIVIDIAAAPEPKASPEYSGTVPDSSEVLQRFRSNSIISEGPTKPTRAENPLFEPTPDETVVRERLLKQLGRAASMGLVDLTVRNDIGDYETPPQKEAEGTIIAHQAGISGQTTFSQELENQTEKASVANSGLDCPTDTDLNTALWATGADFFSGLQELRGRLGGEVTPLNLDVAKKLVQHYLAYGFGAEARALLGALETSDDTDWLRYVALIVSESDAPEVTEVGRYHGCETVASLWALLANELDDDTSHKGFTDPAPVLRAFDSLTVPLQDLLAARVGKALMANGENAAANTVLRIVKRRSEEVSPETSHLSARLHAADGEHRAANQDLISSVRADAPISPLSLAELIESEIASDRKISPETVDLLAGYYQQNRREQIAPRLLTVLILAQALAGQFDESWKLLQSADGSIRDSKIVQSGFAKALAEHGSDLEALRYGAILGRSAMLAADANRMLAERMIALGFPDLAKQFLSVPSEGQDEHARKLLLAKLSFERGDWLAAKAELLGLAGPEFDALIAKIEQNRKSRAVAQASPETHMPFNLERSHTALIQSQSFRQNLEMALTDLEIFENRPQ